MNKLTLIFVLFICSTSFSQSVFPYQEIRLEKPHDYRDAEPMALSAANFILLTPYQQKDADRTAAFNFLVKWTAGDNDYNFNLQGTIRDLAQEKEIMSLLVPAMVKFCLENKSLSSNGNVIETNAIKTVLDYCNNPANNFILKKRIRKSLETH